MINIKKMKMWLIVSAVMPMNLLAFGYDREYEFVYNDYNDYQDGFGYKIFLTQYGENSATVDYYFGSSKDLKIPEYVEGVVYENFYTGEIYTGDDIEYYPPYFEDPYSWRDIPFRVEVKHIGDDAFVGCDDIRMVTIPSSVTSIGNDAFRNCSSLTNVTIPDSVTSIGNDAFSFCWSLMSVTLSDSVTSIGDYAFRDCSSLTSVAIPNSVTSIGDFAFWDCSSLTSVAIPNSVTSIGPDVFSGCYWIENVSIPQCICSQRLKDVFPSLGYGLAITNIIISDGVESIGEEAFDGCKGLRSVTIPDSVTRIAASAFNGCDDLLYDQTSIPGMKLVDGWIVECEDLFSDNLNIAGVRGIVDLLFSNYSNLTSVTIPQCVCNESVKRVFPSSYSSITNIVLSDSVTSIGSFAFSDCSSLTSVTIPNSVTSIWVHAFNNCSGLKSILVGAENGSYKSVNGLLLSKDGKILIRGVNGDVIIPDSVTSIGDYAFAWCSSLTSVTFPDSVTSIGNDAFYGCDSLTSVTIPDSITSIGNNAFYGCNSLIQFQISENSQCYSTRNSLLCNKSGTRVILCPTGLVEVEIPKETIEVESGAFGSCGSLKSVIMPAGLLSDGYEITSDWQRTQRGKTCEYRSESIGDSSSTSMSLMLVGPCEFSFEWKVSSENYDRLSWSLDGVRQDRISGTGGDWRTVICSIPSGEHTIEWEYDKDSSSYSGSDCGWVRIYSNTFQGLFERSYQQITNVVLTANASKINDFAFYGCSSLMSVTLPDSVTSIGSYAFYNCRSLTSVTFPNGVTSIGNYAFYDCDSLMSVTIPNGVTSIGSYAFSGCDSLTSVTIPNSVTNIGDEAFAYCKSLIEIQIPENSQCYSIRNGLLCNKSGTRVILCPAGLVEVEIPKETIEVESGAFGSRGSLKSVTMPAGLLSDGYEITSDWQRIKSGNTCEYRSKSIGNSSSTSMSLVLVGPCEFSFEWKVSSESNRDWLSWSLDGVWQDRISGTGGDWRTVTCSIPDGEHTIEWEYDKDSSSYSGSDCGWVRIYSGNTLSGLFSSYYYITNVVLTANASKINDYAFRYCSSLTSVTIPNGVTSIGDYAFCDCSSLTSVTLPDSVTSIGSAAFYGCDSLTSVTIPDSVTNFASSAFASCNSLVEFKVSENSQYYSIRNGLLCNKSGTRVIFCPSGLKEVEIPIGIDDIESGAFSSCDSLKSVTMPAGLLSDGYEITSDWQRTQSGNTCEYRSKSIGNSSSTSMSLVLVGPCEFSFEWKVSSEYSDWLSWSLDGVWQNGIRGTGGDWRSVTCSIPDGEHTIEWEYAKDSSSYSGSDCGWVRIYSGNTLSGLIGNAYNDITNVVLTANASKINDYAFDGCHSLESVTIPDGVTSIGDYAFRYCDSLRSVTFPDGVSSIGNYAFYDCDSLTSVTIPDSVTSIGSSAFYWCRSLMSVTIPDSVTSIGEWAFYGCSSLTSVTIPGSVTNIGTYAFYNCSSLTSVTISDGVTSIGVYAFRYCSSLTSVTFMGDVPSGIGNSDILDYATKVYYPEKYAAAYEAIVPASQFGGYSPEHIDIVSQIVYAGLQGATHTNPTTYVEGTGVASFLAPSDINGYTFIGWIPTSISADATGPQTITAQWRKDELLSLVISAPSVFETPSCTVTISAEEGAAIYYTLDGSMPTAASVLYTAPIVLTETATVKAIAVREDYFDSPVASCSVTRRIKTLGECVNSGTFSFTTGGDAEWVRAYGESADGFALRSGDITHSQTSRLDMVVSGSGVITFSCRVEGEIIRNIVFDGLAFCIDGVPQGTLIGDSSWTRKSFSVTGPGEHTLSWRYVKDYEGDGVGADCAWLDCVVWESVAEVIPEVKDDSEVEAVLKESADTKLVENIKDATEYNAYREWAAKLPNTTPQQVMEAPQAWLSYALDSDTLIAEAPKEEDIKIDEFKPTASSSGGFDLSVAVDGVSIGENAKTENLAKVFGIEGATTLDGAAFSSDNVGIEFGKPEDGKVKIKAAPKDSSAKSFFMRVKVK